MDNITTFKIETDKIGLKVVRRKGKKVIKERYALSRKDAEKIRTELINEFWGYKIN